MSRRRLGLGAGVGVLLLGGLFPMPPAGAQAPRADSCAYARDGECDEPDVGTGLCALGTDTTDCVGRLLSGDTCSRANDGTCDEGWLGTGLCAEGTDTSDCAGLYAEGQDCASTWDGVCDEPDVGSGRCAPGTDKYDCAEAVRTIMLLEALEGVDPEDARNACRWAGDGECDEPVVGSGLCAEGTDTADCAAAPATNDCASAGDGVCDEGWLGTGLCAAGTDAEDCAGLYADGQLCPTAWDGVCDEPGFGNASCPAGTDKLDCIEAAREQGAELADLLGLGDPDDPLTGLQANACRWAGDGECDEPYFGTGLCGEGTDSLDCREALAPANSCAFANDGTCDEGWLGTGRCPEGTDAADCAGVYAGAATCPTWWDGVCDEPGIGTGRCPAGTDKLDCVEAASLDNLLSDAMPAMTEPRDSCVAAANGTCDERRYGGSGRCPDGTDSTDCTGGPVPEAAEEPPGSTVDEAAAEPDDALPADAPMPPGDETPSDTADAATPAGPTGAPPFSGYMGYGAVPEEVRMAIDEIVETWTIGVVPRDEMEFALALVDLNDDGVKELFVRFRSLPDVDLGDWRTFCRDGKEAPCQISIYGSPAPGIWRSIGSYQDLYDIRILESRGDENYRDLEWADGDRMRFVYNAVGGVWGWYRYVD